MKKGVFGIVLMASMLAACGGSSDSSGEEELLSGVFSDSPVGGLNFATQSTSGVTDTDGVFHYREGEAVVFRIGKLALPAVLASEMVTPLDMAIDGDLDDPSVVNIARLLQSLDEDANPENGIAIPQSTNEVFNDAVLLDATDNEVVESIVRQVYGETRDPVSADQAVSHFINTLSANTDSNGTLDQLSYFVGVDDTFNGENLFVDQDTFSITLDGEVHSGVASVSQGVYQLAGAQDTWFVSVDEAENTKLVCVEGVPTAIADCGDGLYQVFTEEAQAMAFNAPQSVAEAEVLLEPETGAATEAPQSSEVTDQISDQNGAEISLEEFFPHCSEGIVDNNGDGYGWQNDQTCLIVVDGVVVAESLIDSVVEPAPVSTPVAEVTGIAPGAEIVLIPDEEAPASEEATLEVTPAPATETEEVAPRVVQPSDITDIIVLTGQSNAAGEQTDYDPALDFGDESLFAFDEDGQWQVADLHQYWDKNLPSNFASAAEGREPYNNLVFQIGKSLTEQTDRVVGIILVTAPGAGISHWDFNSEFYTKIRSKVESALATLPQKDSIDAMIWMQGETDWLAEGTADPGATGFASTDSEFYRNYYPNKLNQLISNLRSEFWYGATAQFICGETKKADLNQHLMALNNDGDDLTSCAQGSDLPSRDSDPFGNHYSADSLRTLGDRIAALYLSAAD